MTQYTESVDARTTSLVADVEAFMRRLAVSEKADKLGSIGVEHLATGGKRLRARIALAALEALGGDPAGAVAWGAACELLHNASLVHDDLQDGDEFRRGSPTVWSAHGVAEAINLGDLFISLALRAVRFIAVDPATRYELLQAMSEAMETCVRGQSAEFQLLDHCRSPDALQLYFDSVRGKTGTLFQLPVQGAALLAGRSPAEALDLGEEFRALGVLFQLQDDILDLYGEKGRKAVGSDLKEGKVSCLVLAHLHLQPADADWLIQLLKLPRDATDAQSVEQAIHAFTHNGALQESLRLLGEVTRQIEHSSRLKNETALHAFTLSLVRQILDPIRPVMASHG
jgi:geranylgeranyl diphosphate synthase type I